MFISVVKKEQVIYHDTDESSPYTPILLPKQQF
jgi:hypothetical protein